VGEHSLDVFLRRPHELLEGLGIALVIGGVALLGRASFARVSQTPVSSILLVLWLP